MEWITLIAISLVVGMIGEIAKKLVGAKAGDPGWRGVYFVTFRAHALVAGGGLTVALWQLGLPMPQIFGDDVGGAILVGMLAGAIAMVAYDVIVEGVRQWIRHQLAVRGATSPAPVQTPKPRREPPAPPDAEPGRFDEEG
jgi:hypothetical protein